MIKLRNIEVMPRSRSNRYVSHKKCRISRPCTSELQVQLLEVTVEISKINFLSISNLFLFNLDFLMECSESCHWLLMAINDSNYISACAVASHVICFMLFKWTIMRDLRLQKLSWNRCGVSSSAISPRRQVSDIQSVWLKPKTKGAGCCYHSRVNISVMNCL